MEENNDDKQQQIVEEFRKMVLAEKELIPYTEHKFLLNFLHIKNFDCNEALQLLLNYYKMKMDYYYLYKDFRPSAPNMMEVWDKNFAQFLPQPDQHGRKVLVVYAGNWDTTRISFNDLFLALNMCLEVAIEEDSQMRMNGLVTIFDLEGIGFQHVKQCTPSNFKKLVSLIDNGFPLFFPAFHVVNENVFFKMIFTLILPLLGKSIRDRIYIHGRSLDSLHQHISLNALPEKFGGIEPYTNLEQVVEKVFQHEEYLQNINHYGYKKALSKIYCDDN